MPITYGGIDLTPPAYALEAVEQWWHRHRIFEFEYPAYLQGGSHHLPIPYPPRREPPRIGVLSWPNDASRWATCHLLATGQQLTRIQLLAGSPPYTLVISDGTNSVSAPMYRLPARPVEQRGAGYDLYLLTLVDERFYWWNAGDQSAPASPASWSGLLTSLLGSVGVTPTISSVPSAYSTPSSRWSVGYAPLPLLIDAACRTVGLRVVRSLSGAVSCVTYAAAAASDASQWSVYQYQCLAGGRIAASEIGQFVPAKCGVVFLASGNTAASVTDSTLSGLALSQYGGATGVSGRVGQVIADLPASSGNTTIASYATQAATDYYLWQLSQTDATLRAVQAWSPTGLEECVEWSVGMDAIVTRVVARPLSDANTYGGLQSSASSGTTISGTANTVATFNSGGNNVQSIPQYVTATNSGSGYVVTQYTVPNIGANTATSPIQQFTINTSTNTPAINVQQYTNGTNGANGYDWTLTPTLYVQQYTLDGATAYQGVVPSGGNSGSPLQFVVGGNSTLGQGYVFEPTYNSGNVTQYSVGPTLWNGNSAVSAWTQYTVSGSNVTATSPSNLVLNMTASTVLLPPIGPAPTGAPTLTATAGNTQIVVGITLGTGSTNTYVYRGTSSTVTNATGTLVYSGTGTSYTDTGLTNGTTYYYVGYGWNNGAVGAASSVVSQTPTSDTVLDTYTAANGTDPTSRACDTGQTPSALSNAFVIESDACVYTSGSNEFSILSYYTAETNQTVSAYFNPGVDTAYAVIFGRLTNSNNYYSCECNFVNGDVFLVKCVAGTRTTLATYGPSGALTNATLKLSVIGTTLTGYLNGTAVVTTTDSSLITGSYAAVGDATFGGDVTHCTFDNFTVQ